METVVKQVNAESLRAASHEHLAAYIRHCGGSAGGVLVETPEITWGSCGALSSYMNGVVRTRLSPAGVDAAIEAVIEHFSQRGAPFGWFVMPGTTPAEMCLRLAAHGLIHESDEPGMAADLSMLPSDLPANPRVRVVEVLDQQSLQQWIDTWGEAYGANEARRMSRFRFRLSQGLGPGTPYRSFLAYLDDEPVGTSDLFLGAGVAAILWVGTVERARRQGVGLAVTLAPLLEARRLGYQIGALTASELGYPVYRKLGFQEMCRIPVYIWAPPGQEIFA